MSEELNTIFTAAEVDIAIGSIATKINRDYGDQPVHLVGVLRGAAPFLCNLSTRLKMPVTIDFMRVQSYAGTRSGTMEDIMGLSESLEGKNVIIVEDIIDSGQTLNHVIDLLKREQNPNSLKTCVLLDKPTRRTAPIEPDYSGFEIPDVFVVGYGLDYNQLYRNLPYIAEVTFPNAE